MPKEAVFTIKLEPELRDAFMADAAELDRPASQIMRELFKDYLRKREEEKSAYLECVRRKVEKSRASIAAGRRYTDDEVNARMEKRLEELESRKREGDA
jgi:predicted transcriptional regulator